MRLRAQGGILLLPVALVLAITAALAYTMTRSGAMNVVAVDAQYDTDVARYLAEAGLSLAKWQNQKLGCSSAAGFGTVSLPGGTISASGLAIDSEKRLSMVINAETPGGAAQRLERIKVIMHDLRLPKETTYSSTGAIDTYIRDGMAAQSAAKYLELTDGKAHGLIKFAPFTGPFDLMVVKAELKLYQYETNSTQQPRALSVHRVLTDWSTSATWTTPWTSAGGNYVAEPAATMAIEGNREYVLRVDGLVEGWASNAFPQYGLLLKPSGLNEAHFASFENNPNSPKLVVRYHERCI